MEFYWSGLPFPSTGDLPDPGIKPGFPALQADSLLSELPGKYLETDGVLYVLSCILKAFLKNTFIATTWQCSYCYIPHILLNI